MSSIHYKRSYFPIVDDYPKGHMLVRYWDRAATEKTATNGPDWTAGVKMTRDPQGRYYIIDVAKDRVSPFGVEELIRNMARMDGLPWL